MKKQTYEQTQRALMALADDMRQLKESTERVRVQICALAKYHDVQMPL